MNNYSYYSPREKCDEFHLNLAVKYVRLSEHMKNWIISLYKKRYVNKALLISIYYSVCLVFLFTINVRAYVDPSVMTYAIQAIAGIAIALGTFAGVYWRKVRSVLFRGHEDSHKIQEPDCLEFRDPASNTKISLNHAPSPAALKSKESSSNSFAFLPALSLSFALSFMICFYAPLELYFTNIPEFDYDIYAIFKYILLLFAIGFGILLILYGISFLISKKFHLTILTLGLVCFIAFYIQGNFLTGDLPPTDGTKVDWSLFKPQEQQSLLLWIIVSISVAVLLYLLKEKGFKKLTVLVSSGITAVLAVTLITVAIRNDGFLHKAQLCISKQGLNYMSDDRNFVIFVVDAVDSKTFNDLLSTSEPEYSDYFADFTYYPDTLGAYPWTHLALPQLLTGEWYKCQDEYHSYFINAIKNSPFLNRLEQENYLLGLYDMEIELEEPDCYKYENIIRCAYGISDPKKFMMDELRMAFFLYMPYQLKKYEPYAIFNLTNEGYGENHYQWYDPWIYQFFQENPIEIQNQKRFRLIHIEGAHPPLRYDKDLNNIEDSEDASYENNLKACMTVINTYLTCLKESGVYDNTAIVILGDHGFEDKIHSHTRQNPFIVMKGFGEKHEFTISDTPLSYDYLADIYQNMLDGKTETDIIPEIASKNNTRRYIDYDFYHDDVLPEYELTDAHASDPNALQPTGKVYTR